MEGHTRLSTPAGSIGSTQASARCASSTTSIGTCRCSFGCSRSACAAIVVIGYARGEAPLGFAEPGHDLVIEYDEDILRSLKEQDTII